MSREKRRYTSSPDGFISAWMTLSFTQQALLESLQDKVKMAQKDEKTGLLLHKEFKNRVITHTKFSDRKSDQGRSHSLLLIDLDNFHQINEQLGYLAADERVLIPAAKLIQGSLRQDSDLACRWGGEEFLIFLADTNVEDSLVVANRLLSNMNTIKLEKKIDERDFLGACIGVAGFPQGADYDQVFQQANMLVQAGKQNGRNEVIANL